jgi:hypothetical protein
MANNTDFNERFEVEIWLPVPSIQGLEASSHGRIRRLPIFVNGRTYEGKPTFGVIRRSSKKARHAYFGYSYKGIRNVKVHRAVCEAFHGAGAPGCVVTHINENALDNRPENLKWASQKENLNSTKFKAYLSRRDCPRFSSINTEQIYYGIGHLMQGF